jgi:hypothetical protein
MINQDILINIRTMISITGIRNGMTGEETTVLPANASAGSASAMK